MDINAIVTVVAYLLGAGVIVGVMQANQRNTVRRLDEMKVDMEKLEVSQTAQVEANAKIRERLAVIEHTLGLRKEFQLHQ